MSISAGDISFVLQVIILFMLVLGLPLARGTSNKKNLIRHGYLTVFALLLQTIWVFAFLIYLAVDGLSTMYGLPILNLTAILSHLILGTEAIVLGFIVVGLWLSQPLGNMNCNRAKRIMLPLLIIWILSLVIGAITHIFDLF